MKIRGERECQNCGARWSYYETGEATCPECGSLRSVAVEEERQRHTASPADIDLTPHRSELGNGADIVDVADDVAQDCRAYLRKRGFIRGGDLLPLDDRFLAVQELRVAITDYSRDERVGVAGSRPAVTGRSLVARGTSSLDVDRGAGGDEDAERYLLELLSGADEGERPAPDEVSDSLAPARGLAYATAVEAYREDVSTYFKDNPHKQARRVLERIREQEKRLNALGGDLPPAEVEMLIEACRALERYLNGEESTLATAKERLDALD